MKTMSMRSLPVTLLLAGAVFWVADPAQAFDLGARYAAAVRDASRAMPDEVVDTLVAITPDNDSLVWNQDKTLVKVVTWKSQSSYENNLLPYTQTSGNEKYVVWVTAAPYAQDFCRQFMWQHPKATKAALDLRLKKRLGLSADWSYDLFVELWVSPDDLFRPCVDPDPGDSSCDLNFGPTVPVVKNIADYPSFYKNLYFNDFRSSPGVPWTGLGYTYDWLRPWANPTVEVGESEFILSPGTPYIIEQAVPTEEYCQP
jgi:hypothetical protein